MSFNRDGCQCHFIPAETKVMGDGQVAQVCLRSSEWGHYKDDTKQVMQYHTHFVKEIITRERRQPVISSELFTSIKLVFKVLITVPLWSKHILYFEL